MGLKQSNGRASNGSIGAWAKGYLAGLAAVTMAATGCSDVVHSAEGWSFGEDAGSPEDTERPEDTTPPQDGPPEPAPATGDIAAGGEFSCVLRRGGEVWCWGRNQRGQVGDGTRDERLSPTQMTGISTAVDLAAGSRFGCAVLEAGEVHCWGYDIFGSLGDGGDERTSVRATPAPVEGIDSAVAVGAGDNHACAVLESGQIRCWGENEGGRLGDGTTENRSTPVRVDGIDTATDVAGGASHTCAVLEGGEVMCWGQSGQGNLGGDGTADQTTPVRAHDIETARAVSVGVWHTCVALESGEVTCWGANSAEQLGNSTVGEVGGPVRVEGIRSAVALTTDFSHNCARLKDGTTRCWGYNGDGILGRPESEIGDTSATPVRPTGVDDVVAIDTGTHHACAVLEDGRAMCWGHNKSGQLGDGTTEDAPTPVEVGF